MRSVIAVASCRSLTCGDAMTTSRISSTASGRSSEPSSSMSTSIPCRSVSPSTRAWTSAISRDWATRRSASSPLTMLEMAQGAKAIGYRYLGITDHSPRIKVVNGLDAERLVAQSREMADVQARVEGLTLLQGIEVDILEDGSLDLPDAVLEILDVVIASPHVKLRQEATAMTERMLRAVSHPHVDVIGHPTGRRPGSREGATYDIEAVFKEAAKHGVALEIDCDPARMDLSPEMARLALEWGCMFSVDADAHAPAEFAYVPMALWMARRAGIPEDRILNFRPTDELTMAHER